MFHHSSKMQFPVRVEKADPEFAMLLQQAIGGVEGEIRVAMQYFFQAMGARGDARIRDILSSGLAALPVNANGVPFDMSHVYASGNVAADMLANVTAEATGRVLATRLYNLTEDKGMKDFLSFLIARDTMHQQQWLAVIEDMGGLNASLPIPNSFPQENEAQEHAYYCLNTSLDKPLPKGRWSEGPAYDGRGQFTAKEQPDILGGEPALGDARPGSGAQKEQIDGTVPPVSGSV